MYIWGLQSFSKIDDGSLVIRLAPSWRQNYMHVPRSAQLRNICE